MGVFLALAISFIVSLACFILLMVALANKDWAASIVCGLFLLIASAFFLESIDAIRYDNEELKAYEFPASTYKLETRVKENATYSLRDGVVTRTVTKDTLYIISGVEPILFRGEKYSGKELMEQKVYHFSK